MENDIRAALQRLIELAKGRAFHWDVSEAVQPIGWREVNSVELRGLLTISGKETFHATAFGTDFTNTLLSCGARTLAKAEAEAAMMINLMPMAADVIPAAGLPASVHIGPAANDAVPPAALMEG